MSEEASKKKDTSKKRVPKSSPAEVRAAASDGADFRCGFVALVGRSNAGKSTLLNALVNAKVSITAPKPQTTRNRIRGIINLPGRAQIVLVDTPGVHSWRDKELNRRMIDDALLSIGDADAVLFLVDVETALARSGGIESDNATVLEQLKQSNPPTVLGVNKLDKLKQRDEVLGVIDTYRQAFEFRHVVGLSALSRANLDVLLDALVEVLPVGPALFPEELYTDQSSRFLAAEIIREKTIRYTGKEIPFSVAIEIERFEEDSSADLLRIDALIHVERQSQKGIVIGKGGHKLKEIGSAAREELERVFERRVFLQTHVRVQTDWSKDARALDRFGYRKPGKE